MTLSINTNTANLTAQRALSYAENQAQVSMQRLATGHRINSAKDDSAGLAVANQIASRIMGMKAGIQNLTSAVSALQIAEGGMVSIEEQLQRLYEIAVQAANDTNSSQERGYLKQEADMVLDEITRISSSTQINREKLLDGSFTNKNFNLGETNQNLSVSISNLSPESLGFTETIGQLGQTGTISNSTESGRVRAASGPNGIYSVAWEENFLPGNTVSRNAFVRQFDASGNEINYHALGGSMYQGETPAVSVLSNGMTIAAANEIQVQMGGQYDSNLNVKLIRYDGSVEKNLVLSEGNTPGDGRLGSRLDRPNIVDLGNSQFMISYSPTNITNGGGNGGSAQIFDYSGNFVRGVSFVSDTSANEVWIEQPILLDSNNLAVPVIDRSNGASTNVSIRIFDWTNQNVVNDIPLDSITALRGNGYNILGSDNTVSAPLQLINAGDRIGAFWMNADNGKLYGQVFDLSGNSLTSKTELAIDADFLSVSGTTENGTTYFDILYGENASGTERTLFQRFNTGLTASLTEPTIIFPDKSSQAELLSLSDGSLRAYESYDQMSAISYQDFTITTQLAKPKFGSNEEATASLDTISAALELVNSARAGVGAQLQQVETISSWLTTEHLNSAAARARIIDADYSQEAADLAKAQVLQQSSIAVLAQTNSQPGAVLGLLEK
jgi:flagellin